MIKISFWKNKPSLAQSLDICNDYFSTHGVTKLANGRLYRQKAEDLFSLVHCWTLVCCLCFFCFLIHFSFIMHDSKQFPNNCSNVLLLYGHTWILKYRHFNSCLILTTLKMKGRLLSASCACTPTWAQQGPKHTRLDLRWHKNEEMEVFCQEEHQRQPPKMFFCYCGSLNRVLYLNITRLPFR